MNDNNKHQTEQEVHLNDYIAILRRRLGVVLLFFVVVVVTVTIISFWMTPIYRATTTILIDVESPNVLTAAGTVALQQQQPQAYSDYFRSQQEIITSRGLIEKVFNDFNLKNTPAYVDEKDPLKKFFKTITAEPIRDTRLLKLSVDNKDAELAAKLANSIAETYVLRNLYYISRDETMNLLKNEYLKLEAKLSEYSQIYKGKHPKIIRLKEEMEALVARLDNVKKVDASFKFDKNPLTEKTGHALQGLKANNITIQDAAVAPIKPNKPNKLLNILLAIAIGLFGGVGIAFFLEYLLSGTVRDYDDLERSTASWPLLGGIPRIAVKGERLTVFKRDLFTHLKSKEPASEAYRTIRTSIFSTEVKPVRSMLVTSLGPQEGKTTTLCNLGIVMAQAGKKVLLVDADIRKPRLHDVFRHKNEKGLSDFLLTQAELDDIVHASDIENLSFVSSGAIPPNPSELILSQRTKDFIDSAKKKFDIILFDTPPSGLVTDAILLSRVVDEVIIVVESGKTSKRVLARIYKILKSSNTKVSTILNRVDSSTGDYYYYHSYYYGKKK